MKFWVTTNRKQPLLHYIIYPPLKNTPLQTISTEFGNICASYSLLFRWSCSEGVYLFQNLINGFVFLALCWFYCIWWWNAVCFVILFMVCVCVYGFQRLSFCIFQYTGSDLNQGVAVLRVFQSFSRCLSSVSLDTMTMSYHTDSHIPNEISHFILYNLCIWWNVT